MAPSSTLRVSAVARNDAVEKVRICCTTRSVERGAATPSRGAQAQAREGRSQSRAPCLGGSARRRARQSSHGAGFPWRACYNINVATTTLDSANSRTFASFTRGGGMGLDEMTGSPNLTIVPDPSTFRVLPWAPRTGCVLCDEYFNSGVPFHFSPRHLLRRQLQRLANKGMDLCVGLEIEWYLLRVSQEELGEDNIGSPGVRGQPIKTAPAEPGFSYHSESNMDLMQPVLSALTEHFETIGLPLRSIENEWGPGQLECTFAARPALEAADHALLFRTAARQ